MTVHRTERVRIYVKDNGAALGLMNHPHQQKFWVAFSTFLHPHSHLHQNSDMTTNLMTRTDAIKGGVATVSVLILHLRSILNLGVEIALSLSVDGFILPEHESLDVIHRNDIVVVELKSNKVLLPCDNVMKEKKKVVSSVSIL